MNELKQQIEKKILDCNDFLRQQGEHWQWELREVAGKKKAYKEILGLVANYEKTELQRKANIVFKIRKMIDDWEKEYCIDKKCAGMLNCKLCLECEIGMRKGVYKDVLKILDKNGVADCVCIPKKLDSALLEKLAELEHEQWSHWIQYQHSLRKGSVNYVYGQKWKEWLRLSQTPYSELTKEQKESDRFFAHKVLAILKLLGDEK